ncbi:MAG: transketolase [Chloroflexi bacterium]|nr:MAG: transketolase [Chloroflexota bacterium]
MDELQNKAINTLRFLSADAVQQANSGHPGLPMGAAAIAYTIWTKHLKFDPNTPDWADRDRFILSGGHGSMLLYSLLHLTGYDVSLDDLKQFRQWGSRTPGHPEFGFTPGVDTTTGPLGQGFTNGVGMAIAETHLAAEFNQADSTIVDHYVYGIVTDGDLMEGVSSEAASLAGHLKLSKIIYCYDDNRISIDGSTELSFTEDRGKRFEAYGWQVLNVSDGNNVEEIDRAIIAAKKDDRPSLIICRTHIGFGMPNKQDTSKAHGEPPGDAELNAAKRNLGWPEEPRFHIPDEVKAFYLQIGKAGDARKKEWDKLLKAYSQAFPTFGKEFVRRMESKLPVDWAASLPEFEADSKGMASRVASGQVINSLAGILPELMGGSADLTPSNNTWIMESSAFQANNPIGRYLHFGVREHAMGAIVNGLAYHKGLIPFGATFLVFTDYMRGAMRLSALSSLHSIWVLTHDSIGLGEDGPTHQPIEQLAALRAIPNMTVIRPADANETVEAWRSAIENTSGPTVIALSRQALPTIDRNQYGSAKGAQKGAYVLADFGTGKPEILLMASGSEVDLILQTGIRLANSGNSVRVISFPSWELFEKMGKEYKESVLLPDVKKRLAVEMGVAQGWEKWVGTEGIILGINGYGASAPYKILLEKYGFTVENVYQLTLSLLNLEENNAYSYCL